MKCEDAYKILDTTPNDVSALGTAVGCLRIEIKGLQQELKNASKGVESFNSRIGDTGKLLKDYSDALYALGSSMRSFSTDTQAQYKIAEQLAEGYKKVARNIGLSTGRAGDFSKQFKGAASLVAEFGGDIGDVAEIYGKFADSSGRVRILAKDEVANIFKLGAAADLYGDTAVQLYETLDLMGVSNQAATDRMLELIRDSEKIGLNSSKVVKVLADNMKNMQTYSFASGVKGMAQMAKLGVKLRTDVSSMLGMAEKFYEPEAAIEAAANLQMLGGDIAEAFGDPFETMYLARNKPEELAKRLQDMTENMMTFNSETGEYEFPPEVRMQLKSAGDQLGFNTEQMIEMARQTSKMKDVKDQLSVSGTFNEEEMEAISSMAKMDKDGFKVDVMDENGKVVAKSIEDLTKGDLEMLITTPQNEGEYMDEMLIQAQTTNLYLSNLDKKFQYGFVENVDVYRGIEESTNDSLKSMAKVTTDSLEAIANQFKDSALGDLVKAIPGDMKNFDTYVSNLIDSMGVALKQPITLGKDSPLNIDTTGIINISPPSGGNIYSKKDSSMNIYSEESKPKGDNTTASNVNHTHNINGTITFASNDGSALKIDLTDPTIKPQLVSVITEVFNGTSIDGVPGSTVNTS